MRFKLVRRLLFDSINGVRSGIPICCVMFFNKHQIMGTHQIAYTIDTTPRVVWGSGSCGYVQCDKCFNTGNKVNIKPNGVILKGLVM
jgi:hypothetical protein